MYLHRKTMLPVSGIEPPPGINGVNVWDALNNNSPARDMIIHNIDQDDDRGTWQVCWKLEPLNIFNYICAFPNF